MPDMPQVPRHKCMQCANPDVQFLSYLPSTGPEDSEMRSCVGCITAPHFQIMDI
jgi:hypothetical protein